MSLDNPGSSQLTFTFVSGKQNVTNQYSLDLGFQTNRENGRRGEPAPNGDDSPCDPLDPEDAPADSQTGGGDLTPGGGHGTGDIP